MVAQPIEQARVDVVLADLPVGTLHAKCLRDAPARPLGHVAFRGQPAGQDEDLHVGS
jgi:hypothetical protein